MSKLEFGWETLLKTEAPPRCVLKSALLTTYDRPDERLLAEHLLPLLLKLSRTPATEGYDRSYFLLELDRRLKQLHDQVVIISSSVQDEPTDEQEPSATYGWIWKDIRHLTVGRHEKAVQHAKLWLLHWHDPEGGPDLLELVVSSSNLTMAAFKGQIQAGWRAVVEVSGPSSNSRTRSWGVLPGFLSELGRSCDDSNRVAYFLDLLSRSDCPKGAVFVASVPGMHQAKGLKETAWGSACLGRVLRTERGVASVSILAPFVGAWDQDGLTNWCNAIGSKPDHIELVWIAKDHPWAQASRWLLPESTRGALSSAGVLFRLLRNDPETEPEPDLFHADQRHPESRWSHAKLYALRNGKARRILVTSANFSGAAWGSLTKGSRLHIENFELGVLVDADAWPFANLEIAEDSNELATANAAPRPASPSIFWAKAEWDGRIVKVECRCARSTKVKGEIQSAKSWTSISGWAASRDGRMLSSEMAWRMATPEPAFVRLTSGKDSLSVPVFDAREARHRSESVPPGVDEEALEQMRDALLFEQYGGPVADDGGDPEAESPEADAENGAEPTESSDLEALGGAEVADELGRRTADSYAVPAFELARQHLAVVDNWAEQAYQAQHLPVGDCQRQWLVQDAELLVLAFERQVVRDGKAGLANALGARMARQELLLRMKHFRRG